jgi:hypothetical protein
MEDGDYFAWEFTVIRKTNSKSTNTKNLSFQAKANSDQSFQAKANSYLQGKKR